MNYTAGNVYKAIDALAPFGGCMEWDNVGLLVGTPEAAVSGVLVTLDVTPQAVETARQRGLNCIVSHHPGIFHPLGRISARDTAGLCLANGITVISAHTNYDFAPQGVNYALASALELQNIRPFGPENKKEPWVSLIVFVPVTHAEAVYRAMSEAGAGRLGNYSGCAYMNEGEGRFLPKAGAKPFLGSVGAPETAAEIRLEMLCDPDRVAAGLGVRDHAPADPGGGGAGGDAGGAPLRGTGLQHPAEPCAAPAGMLRDAGRAAYHAFPGGAGGGASPPYRLFADGSGFFGGGLRGVGPQGDQ